MNTAKEKNALKSAEIIAEITVKTNTEIVAVVRAERNSDSTTQMARVKVDAQEGAKTAIQAINAELAKTINADLVHVINVTNVTNADLVHVAKIFYYTISVEKLLCKMQRSFC